MTKLHMLCSQIVEQTQGAFACGVVDLNTGRMGMHHTRSGVAKEGLNAAGKAIVAIFSDNPIQELEVLKVRPGAPRLAREMFLSTEGAFYFLKSVPEKDVVFTLVTGTRTNVGVGWMQLRKAVDAFRLQEGLKLNKPVSAPGRKPLPGPREVTQRMRRPTLKSSKPLPRRPVNLTPPPARPSKGHGAATTLNENNPAIRRAFPSIGGS